MDQATPLRIPIRIQGMLKGDRVYQELSVFGGNAHPALTNAICDYLGRAPGRIKVFEFSNENIFVEIQENVRQRDVFLIEPIARPVNNRLMELLIMIDAFRRASAGRITAVIPYFAYGRSDKKDQPRVPITARLIANMIEVAGADRILTVDLHAGQIQGFFNIPVDELTALFTISRYFREEKLDDLVVVGTDVGAAKRARNVAERLGAPLALMEKRRVANDERAEAMSVIGEVYGKQALIIDDEVDTAGTLTETVQMLCSRGVTSVRAAVTHGILSGPAMKRIESSSLQELVLTDTLPLEPNCLLDKMKVLSLAPLLGEAISRIHTGQSVGALFQ